MMDTEELNEREKIILRSVIRQFILTASPVGSRNITKKYDMGISPATVRNIMADLEDSGFINHPCTVRQHPRRATLDLVATNNLTQVENVKIISGILGFIHGE